MSEYINHRGLNIAHINIRSLLSKKDTLSIFFLNINPVVLCISESWLSKCIPDNVVRFQGYDIIRNDRKTLNSKGTTKSGGGLAIFISQDIHLECIAMADSNYSNKDFESLWITLKCRNMKPISICTIYRPPDGNQQTFNDLSNELIELAHNRLNHEIFILGDFNLLGNKRSLC